VDNVFNDFEGASLYMIALISNVINESLAEGSVLGSLQVGKITLIDKQEPFLVVTKKRPITAKSSVILTKIIHKRINKICEREGFYGLVQYGFRQTRSTTDCVLKNLSALRSAKRKKRCISLAFCAKAYAKVYDTVCRELLYTSYATLGLFDGW